MQVSKKASQYVSLAAVLAGFQIFLGMYLGRMPQVAALFSGDYSGWPYFWLYTLSTIVVVAAIILALNYFAGRSLGDLGLAVPKRALLIVGATSYILMVFAAYHKGTLTIDLSKIPGPMLAFTFVFPWQRIFYAGLASVIAGVGEEIVYRGFLLKFFSSYVGSIGACLAQALLFGFHHGGFKQGLIAFSARAVMGLILGAIVLWRRNLNLAIWIHYMLDASVIFAGGAH